MTPPQDVRATVDEPRIPHNLADAAASIDMELRRKRNKIMKLEESGGEALAEAHADFMADLGRDAIRLARKDGLQCVERTHVELAVKRYGTGAGESRLGSALSTLGGLLAGAGLAAGYGLLFTPGPHSTGEQTTTLAFCIFGFFLLAIGLTLTTMGRR